METEKIQFQKQRDFGEKLNATFTFLKAHYKPLLRAILYICGPFIVIQALLNAYMTAALQDMILTRNFSSLSGSLGVGALMVLFAILSSVFVLSTILSYVKLYAEHNKENIEVIDVWHEAKKHLLPIIGASLGTGLVIVFGFIFFIIPGIYLAVVYSLVLPIMIFEDKGFFDASSRAFKLISDKWWSTCGIIFVTSIIQSLLSYIIVLPVEILVVIFGLHDTSSTTGFQTAGALSNISQTLHLMISMFLTCISVVGITFQYYNLVELKESKGLLNKIDSMGTQSVASDE